MSNIVKRIKTKVVKSNEEIYNTLVGSIVVSVGIINGLDEKEMKSYYNKLKKKRCQLPMTVAELTKLVWDDIGKEENTNLRSNLVLVFDLLNIRTPLVAIVNDEGNLLPLKPNGDYTGILMSAAAGSQNVSVEFLFDEEGNEIIDGE